MHNIIFKNDIIEIFTTQRNVNLNRKCIRCKVTARNPKDGITYTKFAGWISGTLALHGGSGTPNYIYEAGLTAIEQNEPAIREALKAIGKDLEPDSKAGCGVTNKIAHPKPRE
jgi:hypothetical protein